VTDEYAYNCYLPVAFNQSISTGEYLNFTGYTTSFTTLASPTYSMAPEVLQMGLVSGDVLQITGAIQSDLASYAHAPNFHRLVVRRTSSNGAFVSNLNSDDIQCARMGDNDSEVEGLTWPLTSVEIDTNDGTTVWIGWEIRRRSVSNNMTLFQETRIISVSDIVRCVSSVKVTVLKKANIPLLDYIAV